MKVYKYDIQTKEFLEDIEEEDEKELESEMEHLITIAGEFYDREIERYEE